MYLCLDADQAGEKATQDLQQFFPNATDLREHYGILKAEEGVKILTKF